MTQGDYDFRLQDLSLRAQEGLQKALAGRTLTLDVLRSLTKRDIRNLPRCGRDTAEEIAAWAARHGVDMPDGLFD